MISYNEAQDIIQSEFNKLNLKTEQIDLLNSVNRVLAEDVLSDINLPPFNNSAMDGFAIKFNSDIKTWKIAGEIPAGKFNDYNIDKHSSVSIMTGSKLPSGCDTVIPVEDVEQKNDFVYLKEGVRFAKGINTRKLGEDLLKGKLAILKDTLLKPHHIAVAASCGRSTLKVYKRLRIGVLATGDELVDIHETPTGDKIRCSNLYSIISAIRNINMHSVNFGIAKDDKQLIHDRLKWALESELDILITTGGVSFGKFDYVKEVYESLGVETKFWQVKIKPGKPLLFGTYSFNEGKTMIFGLPGNPVSSLVNFFLFVEQNILNLFKLKINNKFSATLQDDLKKEDSKRHFMRGVYSYSDEGKYYVKKVGNQSSGNLAEMGKSNCLIIVEEDRMNPRIGETVECIMI
ncbi:MAG: molybdopterin molybdotransferase MoeA [Ignavibacteriaceae bacterium]